MNLESAAGPPTPQVVQGSQSEEPSPPQCRRCRKLILQDENEIPFRELGLCFWCAYVDPQA